MKNYVHNSKYFYGNEISTDEIKHGYINYRTLAKCFDVILCNDITKLFYSTINNEYTEPEQVNGYIDNSDEIDQLQEQLDEILEQYKQEQDTEKEKALEKQIDKLQEQIDDLQEQQDNQSDIYQYYIISHNGARILQELTDEIVYYIECLDVYIWGVTHFGTPWSGVFTDIKIELNDGEI